MELDDLVELCYISDAEDWQPTLDELPYDVGYPLVLTVESESVTLTPEF